MEVINIDINDITPYISNLQRSGSQYVGACPCCGDDHHLYIKETDNHVSLYCQKCQAPYEDLIKGLGVGNDIPPKFDPVTPKSIKEKSPVIE